MMPEFLQWIIVIAAIAAAVFFIWRMFRSDSSACSGCALSDTCSRKGVRRDKKNCRQ